ncbi:MAG: hypothetical protein GY739_13115 [Mesoflavibacter sp.]|nr:hypothetical protein [Mesoflavibacter sp.]
MYREFIAQTVRWIHYTYRVNKNEITPFSLKTYHWVQNTNDLMYHIRCDTIKDYLKFQNKLRDDDIIVATDSGRDLDSGLTGIGIFIKDRDIFHRYSEPIGKISNNFGELFAIGKSEFCLNQFNINTTNRRVIVMTDSLCNFCPLISPPKNIDKQIKFPSLFKQTQRFLKNMKAILWKIKSHTDKINIHDNYYAAQPRVQPYNGEADLLAEQGKSHPENKPGLPLHINNFGQYYNYTKTKCLSGANNFNIVRQFWLRTISESPFGD